MAVLLSIGTAVPPYELLQQDVLASARAVFGPRYPSFQLIEPVFVNAGIERRYGVKPMDWYTTARGWPERTAAYIEGATALFISAATKALKAAGCVASEIDAIVTVSSTGIATPSLEARASQSMGFRNNVRRLPVFGLGCAGGVTGLATAARLADAQPGSTILFVAVEICTLACRLDQMTKANIVATALFGDGAAACVLRSDGDGLAKIDHAAEFSWPDTLDIMGWAVDEVGFSVIFDRSIPDFMDARLAPAMARLLDEMRLDPSRVDRFICHPGGAKVITALEQALKLNEGALDHERAVLADFGNMSAPTAIFVLDRVVHAGLPKSAVLTALGPGFTLSALSLERI